MRFRGWMGNVVVLGYALHSSVSLLMGCDMKWTCPFCALKEVVDKLAPLKSGVACYPIRESLQAAGCISIDRSFTITWTYSTRRRSTNSGENLSPLMYSVHMT